MKDDKKGQNPLDDSQMIKTGEFEAAIGGAAGSKGISDQGGGTRDPEPDPNDPNDTSGNPEEEPT